MPTSTAERSSTNLAGQDRRLQGIKLEPSADLTNTSSPGQPQKKTLTTVEITPIRATADINDAIRRQRRGGGLSYSKSHPSASHAKPLFRAVLTGNIHPGNAHCTIAPFVSANPLLNGAPDTASGRCHGNGQTPHSSNNAGNLSGSSGTVLRPYLPATSGGRIGPTAVSSSTKNGAGPSGSGSNSGYSVVYDRQGRMTTISVVNNNLNGHVHKHPVETGGGHGPKPSSRPPRLALTHRSKTHSISEYPSGFNRSLSADNSALVSPSNDDRSPAQSKHTTRLHVSSSGETPSCEDKQAKVNAGNETVSSNDSQHGASASSRSTSTTTIKISPKSTSVSTSKELVPASKTPGPHLQKSRSLDASKGPAQRSKETGVGMTCLQFADSVLGAIGSDLNHVYQLCQAKVRYAEFLELSQTHRITDSNNNVAKDGDHTLSYHKGQITGPGSSLTSLPSSYKSPHSLTTLPLPQSVSPRTISGLPDLPVKAKPGTFVASVGQSTSSKLEVKGPLATEISEIDYDKPVTIIIDSDETNESWTKTARSILKTSPRVENASSGKENWVEGGSHTRSVPAYLEVTNAQNESISTLPSRSRDPSMNEQLDGLNTNKNNNNKGRLVRFSADHKIHEFVPLEPVTQKSDL